MKTKEASVKVHGLSKSYGPAVALDEVSFEVKPGELFGIIGPDGAGKTTLFKMLVTLLLPDKGNASVAGYDILKEFKKIREVVGYMPGRFSLYHDLTVRENLEFFATIFDTTIKENYELVKDIYSQIEKFEDRRAGKLSGGMKQKLALSCALIHKPTVLFLDEPTTGVDPVSRVEFWEMLKNLKTNGITILVSTPYMDEASLCDRVALIQKGKILKIDTPKNIESQYERKILAVSSSEMYKLLLDLKAYPSAHSVFTFGDNIHYTDTHSGATAEEIAAYLTEKGHTSIEIHEVKANIEDSFMALMETAETHE